MSFFSKLFGTRKRSGEPTGTSIYSDLREQALSVKPSDIGLKDFPESAPVALLMETGYPNGIATLVAVADGSTSLYFSNGGGVIGAGTHAAVREVVLRVLSFCSKFSDHLHPTLDFPSPAIGSVRFYLVTQKGTYTASAEKQDLGHNRLPMSPLFHACHELISAIRDYAPEQA